MVKNRPQTVTELLETINELTTPNEKIQLVVDALLEQNREVEALKKQFEDHENLSPEFLRKEAEFQKETKE